MDHPLEMAYDLKFTLLWGRASINVNEAFKIAIANFYRDDSDSVFLRLSHDLRPNILRV